MRSEIKSTQANRLFLHRLIRFSAIGLILPALISCGGGSSGGSSSSNKSDFGQSEADYELKLLGKFVFFDEISEPAGVMSCASCHDPATGFTGPDSEVNMHQVAMEGAVKGTFGTLRPPTAAYSSFIAAFDGRSGGHFWDGRAEGNNTPLALDDRNATRHVGEEIFYNTDGVKTKDSTILSYAKYFTPITDQALNPMPNPVEQNIERQKVCEHVQASEYAPLYQRVWGETIKCDASPVKIQPEDRIQRVEVLVNVVEDGQLICVDRGGEEITRVADGEDCPTDPTRTSPLQEPVLEEEIELAEDTNFDISFKRIVLAIGAYEHSSDLNQFSSRRDISLRAELKCMQNETVCQAENPDLFNDPDYTNSKGKFPLAGLTDQENYGHDLMYAIESELNPEGKNAGCGINCHRSGEDVEGLDLDERYTDDRFHNIGTPYNPEIAQLTNNPDLGPENGFGNHIGNPSSGQHKTPTLRNVDQRPDENFVKAFGHNGWFKSLDSIMHFYNTAFFGNDDIPYEETTAAQFGITQCPEDPDKQGYTPNGEMLTEAYALANNCWPAPAMNSIIPRRGPDAVGNLGLTLDDEAAIVAYMKTLSDQKQVKKPGPGDLAGVGIFEQ